MLTTEFNWTSGCIATDNDITDKIYQIVTPGTKVIIQE